MIDWLKNNWKTALIGGITFIVILLLCCCESKPVEEAPVKEVHEMTDEEIEKEVF